MSVDKDHNVWTQLLKIIKFQKVLKDVQTVASPNLNGVIDEIYTAFDNSRGEKIDVESLYAQSETINSTLDSTKQTIKQYADNAILRLVESESYPADLDGDIPAILGQMRKDMLSAGHYILLNTATIALPASGATNVGSGYPVVHGYDPTYAIENNGIFKPEIISITCTADGQLGGTGGSETFSIIGEKIYPVESNTVTGTGVGPEMQTAGAGTLLTNGDFEEWTGNVPASWDIVAGAASANILVNSATPAYGTLGLQLKETAAVNPKIKQDLNTVLGKETKYLLTAMVKADTVTSGNIVIKIDGTGLSYSGSAIINIGSSYPATNTRYTAVFDTPNNVPSDINIYALLSGATANELVDIDDITITPMVIHGGMYFGFARGLTDNVTKDKWTVTVSNSRAANLNTFLGDYYGFQMPVSSAGASTVVDTL